MLKSYLIIMLSSVFLTVIHDSYYAVNVHMQLYNYVEKRCTRIAK